MLVSFGILEHKLVWFKPRGKEKNMDMKAVKVMEENWIAFLRTVMRKNGCSVEIRTIEDVMGNLTYLTQKTDMGGVFLPLQYKKIVEKLLFGFGKSAIEYDKDDVYFENVGDITICTANVRWVLYGEDGEKVVLGRGTCSVNIDEIMPGEFKSAGERAAKMRATAIGKAKTRAYYDGGLGLELFGDIPEVVAADDAPIKEETPKKEAKATKVEAMGAEEIKAEPEAEVSSLPTPKPKRVPKGLKAVKAEKETPEPVAETTEVPVPEKEETIKSSKPDTPEPDEDELTLEEALLVKADAGNFKGDTLEAILEILPRNIIWLTVNGKSERVRKAAALVKQSNDDLKNM